MALKVNKCCCCVDLRIGCIILAVVGLVLAIISIGISSGWGSIIGLILAIVANGCLLFAAVYTNGTIQMRSIATLVYIIVVLLNAVLVFIAAILQIVDWADQGANHGNHAAIVVLRIIWVILDLYFALVAFSFYQEGFIYSRRQKS